MNSEYLGADGKGMVAWDDAPYFVKNDAKLLSMMHNVIKNTFFERHRPTLDELALKAICINSTKADDYSTVGNTRFGGLPDLPEGETYPTLPKPYKGEKEHYLFFAQINCEEIASFQEYLPRKGMLYFFILEEDTYTCEVVYYPHSHRLQSAKSLDNLNFNSSYRYEPYKPMAVEYRQLIALPAFFDGKHLYEYETDAAKPDSDSLVGVDVFSQAFSESLGRKGVRREHNNVYYTDMNHTINDNVRTISGQSPNEVAASARNGNPEDWMVLLRLHSDRESDFGFHDAGELYFLIHKSDLAKSDFSNVFAFAESS